MDFQENIFYITYHFVILYDNIHQHIKTTSYKEVFMIWSWGDFSFFIELLLQSIVTGLLVGGLFALASVGLGLIFGLMRVINFAQPDFMMLGMYVAFFTVALLGGVGTLGPIVTPFLGAFVAAVLVAVLGWITHRIFLSRIAGENSQDSQIIMTLGIALILQNGGLLIFGADPLTIRTPLSAQAWVVGFLFFNKAKTIASLAAVLMTIALYLFMSRTLTGKSLRAAADNPIAATYMGINVNRAHRIGFSIGIGITAAAGGLIATYHPFQPYIGLDFLIIMYASVVLGGLGSITGAFWGGLIIGLIQQVSTNFVPIQLQNMVVFIAFLAIVLLRPHGLFGRATNRV